MHALTACLLVVGATTVSPFTFLQPTIEFSDDDLRQLDDREIVVQILPADGQELAAMAAAAIDVGPDALVRSMRNVVDLKKSALVPQLGRLSARPRLDDFRTLTIEDVDLAEMRRCEPGSCGLKLEADEIARLQRVKAGTDDQLTQEFRRILLARAQDYLQHGGTHTASQFSTLLQHSPYLSARQPALATYLERFPASRLPGAESFLYWSKELYAWKPMITLTHVTIVQSAGTNGTLEALVAARDIYSSRYTSGSLTLTLLFRAPDAPSRHYLVYINRTWVDGVRALWRPIVEHRIKKQARTIFADVRTRIERSGARQRADNANTGSR